MAYNTVKLQLPPFLFVAAHESTTRPTEYSFPNVESVPRPRWNDDDDDAQMMTEIFHFEQQCAVRVDGIDGGVQSSWKQQS